MKLTVIYGTNTLRTDLQVEKLQAQYSQTAAL